MKKKDEMTFQEVWEVFQSYWKYLDKHPNATFEEAEAFRIKKTKKRKSKHEKS